MIPVALIVASGGFAVVLVALLLARTGSLEYTAAREHLLRPGAEMLAYDVPNGQDPAAIMTALRHAGYHSVEDTERAARRVLVACPGGVFRDRNHVREVIASLGGEHAVPVLFTDEREQAASS